MSHLLSGRDFDLSLQSRRGGEVGRNAGRRVVSVI
jgi:hypothetical protein